MSLGTSVSGAGKLQTVAIVKEDKMRKVLDSDTANVDNNRILTACSEKLKKIIEAEPTVVKIPIMTMPLNPFAT